MNEDIENIVIDFKAATEKNQKEALNLFNELSNLISIIYTQLNKGVNNKNDLNQFKLSFSDSKNTFKHYKDWITEIIKKDNENNKLIREKYSDEELKFRLTEVITISKIFDK